MSDSVDTDTGYSLFDQEERVLRQTEIMLRHLEEVAGGVRGLADAYRQVYKEQRRMVRLSDRMQLELQKANQQLSAQADDLKRLNEVLQEEIERRSRLEGELRRVAVTDTLTGAFTRGHLFELAEREVGRSRRTGTPLSVLLMDLDHFKAVNDTHGHAAGDRALQLFADVCRRRLRQTDVFGRIGGEEFAVVLPDTPMAGAAELAERIREQVAHTPLNWQGNAVAMTISIGVAGWREEETDVDRLMARADAALYQAKHGGRNRVASAPA